MELPDRALDFGRNIYVDPDVMWQGTAPPAYDRDADSLANDAIAAMGDAQCRPN